jgi:hypothetical protein
MPLFLSQREKKLDFRSPRSDATTRLSDPLWESSAPGGEPIVQRCHIIVEVLMPRSLCLLVAAFSSCLSLLTAEASISYPTAGGVYSQNFDGLITSGTNQTWSNNSTIAGWSLFNSTGSAIGAYNAGDGGSNTGSFYSFGTGTATERALGGAGSGGTYFGSPASGAIAGWIAVAITNTTGSILTDVALSYDGEQWRNGGNTNAQTMVLEYGFGASFATVSSWIAPGGAFDFTSPVVGSSAAAVNGNVAGFVAGRGGAINSLSWANNDTLWIRWVERNDAGNDHGLAIDNFSFSARAATTGGVVPEASSLVTHAILICMTGLLVGSQRLLRRSAA